MLEQWEGEGVPDAVEPNPGDVGLVPHRLHVSLKLYDFRPPILSSRTVPSKLDFPIGSARQGKVRA